MVLVEQSVHFFCVSFSLYRFIIILSEITFDLQFFNYLFYDTRLMALSPGLPR